MVRRKRVREVVEHPARFLRFDPSEWPGESLADRRLLWVDEFRRYWSEFPLEFPAAPLPVEGRSRGAREYSPSHLMWLMNRVRDSHGEVWGEDVSE